MPKQIALASDSLDLSSTFVKNEVEDDLDIKLLEQALALEQLKALHKRQATELDTLSFRGGGSKGVAYAGAIDALTETKHLDKITRVYGTSIGALTALMLALGCSSEFIKAQLFKLDLAELIKNRSLGNLVENGGLVDAKELEALTISLIQQRLGQLKLDLKEKFINFDPADKFFIDNLTANNLDLAALRRFKKISDQHPSANLHIRDLIITGTEIELVNGKKEIREVFFSTTEDDSAFINLPLYKAGAISACLPGVFTPIEYKGKLYSDGGIVDNTPSPKDDSKEKASKYKTIIFTLETESEPIYSDYLYKNAPCRTSLAAQLIDLSTQGHYSGGLKQEWEKIVKVYHHNTVPLNTKTISTVSTDVSIELKNDVIAEAKIAVLSHLANHNLIAEEKAAKLCNIEDTKLSREQLASKNNLKKLQAALDSSIELISHEEQKSPSTALNALKVKFVHQKNIISQQLKSNDVRFFNKEEFQCHQRIACKAIEEAENSSEAKQSNALRKVLHYVTKPLAIVLGLWTASTALVKNGFFAPSLKNTLHKTAASIQRGEIIDIEEPKSSDVTTLDINNADTIADEAEVHSQFNR